MAWLADFEARQREPEEVARWTARTLAAIVEAAPELPGDLIPLIERAVTEHWLAFLDQLWQPEVEFVLVEPAAHAAAEVARRHIGLPVLLKVYQVGQEATWAFAIEVIEQAPIDEGREELLVWFWTKATRWFGLAVEQSVVIHQAESERVRRRGDRRRYETVAQLLGGTAVGQGELSAALGGHPVGGEHLALIAHAMTTEAVDDLEAALTEAARTVPGARLVVVRPGGRQMWGWLTGAVGACDGLADAELDPARVRIAVGGPGASVTGFAAAHHDAAAAEAVARAPGQTRAVTFFDRVMAPAILATRPESARRFTAATLGVLADPAQAHLRETVTAALTADGTADQVAAGLGVHKNTVRYRLDQAERLLGRSLRARAGELLLALEYHRLFGP